MNVPEDVVECESFTISSIFSLLLSENKYYLQLYLSCACKILYKQMIDYIDGNLFESDED